MREKLSLSDSPHELTFQDIIITAPVAISDKNCHARFSRRHFDHGFPRARFHGGSCTEKPWELVVVAANDTRTIASILKTTDPRQSFSKTDF